MTKERKGFCFFLLLLLLLSHLSHRSLLLFSPLTPHIIFRASVSICQLNPVSWACLHPRTYTYSYNHRRSSRHTHLHSRSLLLFHFKRSWLQGRRHVFLYISCCLTLSVSAEPPRSDRLHYISALVRPGDVFTQIINLISCPSIHPYVLLQLHP